VEPTQYWDTIYRSKDSGELSWSQRVPSVSLELVGAREGRTSIIDVGAGNSRLVDHLIDDGWNSITLVDLSPTALEEACRRLSERCTGIDLVTGDICRWRASHPFDVWHDRAVFHFLSRSDRIRYVEVASATVQTGGHLVIGAFAPEGPAQCSGLDVTRYSVDGLAEIFQPQFQPVRSLTEVHETPWGVAQAFTWVVLERQ
jgi:SAM-dependent methyltransferase